jgi:hypothetical protein
MLNRVKAEPMTEMKLDVAILAAGAVGLWCDIVVIPVMVFELWMDGRTVSPAGWASAIATAVWVITFAAAIMVTAEIARRWR